MHPEQHTLQPRVRNYNTYMHAGMKVKGNMCDRAGIDASAPHLHTTRSCMQEQIVRFIHVSYN
jgi:hypothetical protein